MINCISCNIEMNDQVTPGYQGADCVSRGRCLICEKVISGYCRKCRDEHVIETQNGLYDIFQNLRAEHTRDEHYPVDLIEI